VLKFVSGYLALSYLAFATVVVVGLIQWLAARRSIIGLAFLDYQRAPAWQQALGPSLAILSYAWFFGTRRELITPGPAGLELTVLFGGSVLLALGLTVGVAGLLRPHRQPAVEPPDCEVTVRLVDLGPGRQGRLFCRAGQGAPQPGLCLVPDPATPEIVAERLASRLADQGSVVLLAAWPGALQSYPDALALVPAVMCFLSREPLVDRQRIALIGVGLGGDLVLRAAASDRQVRAVAALAPLLDEYAARPGGSWLYEMTFTEGWRWRLGGRRRRLARDLAAWEALGHLKARSALLLYGDQDAIVALQRPRSRLTGGGSGLQMQVIAGEGHLSLPGSPAVCAALQTWLAEGLRSETSEVETAKVSGASGK
jgi:hypothetical protein